jgi:holo-[acyl-carrier protein] synthase
VIGIGTDLVELDRFRLALRRTPRLPERLFSDAERAYAARRRDPTERLAARFAAKEAVTKALGTGIRGLAWREMEILADPLGKPLVRLHGRALERAARIELKEFAVSLSHSREYAVAMVVAS